MGNCFAKRHVKAHRFCLNVVYQSMFQLYVRKRRETERLVLLCWRLALHTSSLLKTSSSLVSVDETVALMATIRSMLCLFRD